METFTFCFHSINVPSEWELSKADTSIWGIIGFHSINVPSEWERTNYMNNDKIPDQVTFPFN